MRVRWSAQAREDLAQIAQYVAQDSAVHARRLLSALITAGKRIANAPLGGRLVPEDAFQECREALHGNYRLLYRVFEKQIVILAVIHGARDLARLAKKPWDI